MDINQLYYFLTIAKYENLSKAQDELHVAQPALSTGLARMEKQIGVRLFDRQKGRLTLNPYGEIMVRHAQVIVDSYNEALREIESRRDRDEYSCVVAVLDMGYQMEPISEFLMTRTDVSLNSFYTNYTPGRGKLDQNEYDLIITPLPVEFEDFKYEHLYSDELFLIIPRGHRLFNMAEVSIEDIDGEDICLTGYNSHFSFFFENLIKENGLNVRCHYSFGGNLIKIAHSRGFLSVAVETVIRRIPNDPDIRTVHFSPKIIRRGVIGYSSKRPLNFAAKAFLGFLREEGYISDQHDEISG